MTLRTLLVRLGFKGDVAQLVNFDRKISGLKSNLISLTAAFATATAATGYFLNEAAKMEQVVISFKVLAGGIKVGKKLLRDVLEFAAITPFEIPGVLKTTQSFLGFGVQARDMVETMREVGDVAAGMNKPLDILAQSYGRVVAGGKLLGRVFYNLRLQGVPIAEFLLKATGIKTVVALESAISRGKITSDVFVKAWSMMRKERFFDILKEQALTFLGLLSNVKDQSRLLSIGIGNYMLPEAKKFANYLFLLLQKARTFVETSARFKKFMGGFSSALGYLNELFLRLFFRTKDNIESLGGFMKLFKLFASVFGILVSIKTLSLIGSLFKMVVNMLTFTGYKMAFVGAALLSILLIMDDIFAFLQGKESVIGEWLNMLDMAFPKAYETITKWLKVIKREIEGFSLLIVGIFEGLFTGDWRMAKAGLAQISEAYQMMKEPPKTTKEAKDLVQTAMYPTIPLEPQTMAEKPITKRDWKTAYRGIKYPQKQESRIGKIKKGWKSAQKAVDEFFFPGGTPEYEGGTGIFGKLLHGAGQKPITETWTPGAQTDIRGTMSELKNFYEQDAKRRSAYLKEFTMNNNIKIDNLPKNANSKEVAAELGMVLEPMIRDGIGKMLKGENSATESVGD